VPAVPLPQLDPQAELARLKPFQQRAARGELAQSEPTDHAALPMQHYVDQAYHWPFLFSLMERTSPEALPQELLQWHGQLQALLAPARWGPMELQIVPAAAVSAAQFYFSTDNHELRNHQLHWPCR
jgi:hypothetical protein